jgi:hydroxyethylthiazole kinase
MLRTVTPLALLGAHRPFIVRGNASEIMTLAGSSGSEAKGVDSTAKSDDAAGAARTLAVRYHCAVAVSGETDIVVEAGARVRVQGGSALMPRVTGLGCTATAICAAFAAVNKNPFEAALNACVTMKVAGEMAADKSAGPGTLQLHFYDALYSMTAQDVAQRIKVAR